MRALGVCVGVVWACELAMGWAPAVGRAGPVAPRKVWWRGVLATAGSGLDRSTRSRESDERTMGLVGLMG